MSYLIGKKFKYLQGSNTAGSDTGVIISEPFRSETATCVAILWDDGSMEGSIDIELLKIDMEKSDVVALDCYYLNECSYLKEKMSTKYKTGDEVPSAILCNRLKELSKAVTRGEKGMNEFYMRIPAEVDHDADLVLSAAAKRIADLEMLLIEIRRKLSVKKSQE